MDIIVRVVAASVYIADVVHYVVAYVSPEKEVDQAYV